MPCNNKSFLLLVRIMNRYNKRPPFSLPALVLPDLGILTCIRERTVLDTLARIWREKIYLGIKFDRQSNRCNAKGLILGSFESFRLGYVFT